MATFTYTPDFGASKESKPSVQIIKFGDGYEGRVAHGLNTNPQKWNLQFSNRDIADIDAIEAFLEARGATESFDWTPPRALSSIKAVCREWTRSIENAALDSLSATFEEVFEP